MFELLNHTLTIGIIVVSFLAVVSYKLRFVDFSGLVSAYIIGIIVWYTGGPGAFALLLFFLVSASIATKYKYKAKEAAGVAQEGKGMRNWKNVIYSGLIPTLFSIGGYLAPNFGLDSLIFTYGFIGAVATTTADTLASEIGVFSQSKPRLITNLRRKVPRGTIGAVSSLGEYVALFSSLAVGILAYIFAILGIIPVNNSIVVIIIATVAGFIGCNTDSLIGAVFQAKYQCTVCGKITDKTLHCGKPTVYRRGFKRVDNTVVNFTSSTLGATIAIILVTGLLIYLLSALFLWLVATSGD